MNKKITLLSFAWMFGIVLFHACNGNSPRGYAELMSDFRIGGVSFFYIVSGFFLMKHFDEITGKKFYWWKREIVKRLRSLGIPYLLWCALGLNGTDWLRQFGLVGICPTANFPLWYVKNLLIFCLISPLIISIIRRLPSRLFAWMAVSATIILPWLHLPAKFGIFLSLLMFATGIGAAIHQKTFADVVPHTTLVLSVIWFSTLALRIASVVPQIADWPLRCYSAGALAALSFVAVEQMPDIKALPSVCSMTFFVYCSHALFLRYVHPFSWMGWIGCFLNGFLAFASCLTIGLLLRRFMNTIYRALSGNR